MSVFEIVFSPTGGTEKVSGLVAGALDGNTVTVDLTDNGQDFRAVSMTKDDVAVISVPSYAGRVPAVVVDRLGMVRGNGALAVLVCVYGNRAFEDALVELEDVAKRAGFRVVARLLPLLSIPLLVSLLLGDRMRRMWRNLQSLRSRSGKSCWMGICPSPLFPAIVLISKLEATAWCPRQRGIVSPAVPALWCALFELSTRTIQARWMVRRASPACVALLYAHGVLASLIPLRFPPLPRC